MQPLKNYNTNLNIAIILVICLISVTCLLKFFPDALNNYIEKRRDDTRFSDISTLQKHINGIESKTTVTKSSRTIYISLPSDRPDCSDRALPKPPNGWVYSCKPWETYTNSDGSGWIPIDTRDVSKSRRLPIDPINDDLHYYSLILVSTSLKKSTDTRVIFNAEFFGRLESKLNQSNSTSCGNLYTLVNQQDKFLKLFCSTVGIWSFDGFEHGFIFDDSKIDRVAVPDSGIGEIWEDGVLNFRSSGQSINLGNDKKYKLSSFSLGIDVSADTIPSKGAIVQKGNIGYAANNYGIVLSGDEIYFTIRQVKSGESVLSGGKIKENSWHNIFATYDSETREMALYVNGKLVSYKVNDTDIDYTYNPPLVIGKDASGGFQGKLDNLKIYNRALTPDEVSYIYNWSSWK